MDNGLGIGTLSVGADEMWGSKFDLFAPITTVNGVSKAHKLYYRPISSTSSKGPYVFDIPSDPMKWTDIKSINLHGKMQIKKKDSNGMFVDLPNGEDIGVVNNIFHSLWSSVSIKINDTEITDPSSGVYPYKAYVENLLSYSPDTKKTKLRAQGYIEDTSQYFDDFDSKNEAYETRKKWFAESKWNDFKIPLHNDIMSGDRDIPPNVKLMITLQRTQDNFCLMKPSTNTNEYSIELENIYLTLVRYETSTHIEDYHTSELKNGKIPTIPIQRNLIKSYTVQKNTNDLSCYNIIFGRQLPTNVYVFMVDQTAFNGSPNKNPFNFKYNDMCEASLVVNGVNEPNEMYKLDYKNNDVIDLYSSFLENTGIGPFENITHGINLDEYYGGYFILAWDRSPMKINGLYAPHYIESGSININLKTKTQLKENITILVYATYNSALEFKEGEVATKLF